MLWLERRVVGALAGPDDALHGGAISDFVDSSLRAMPQHLRLGVAAESVAPRDLGPTPRRSRPGGRRPAAPSGRVGTGPGGRDPPVPAAARIARPVRPARAGHADEDHRDRGARDRLRRGRGGHRRPPGRGRQDRARGGRGTVVRTRCPRALLPRGVRRRYRHQGACAALGSPGIAFAEGRCVGGSTEINSGLYHRLPERLAAEWRAAYASPRSTTPRWRTTPTTSSL